MRLTPQIVNMTYKPSEHGGLKEDGTPDKRVQSEHGFGGDTQRASELGHEGGKTQPDNVYKPSEHGGTKKDGSNASRTDSSPGFGGARQAASEAGHKGGSN